MPVKQDAWPEGTPAWVDLMASDFAAAKDFYGGVFGWEFSESGEEFGYYAVATLDGEAVAGIGPAQGLRGAAARLDDVSRRRRRRGDRCQSHRRRRHRVRAADGGR